MSVKINDLSAASAVTDSMQFETDTGGSTAEKVTGAQLKTYCQGREILTSSLTLHFSSGGNDSNDGLSSSNPKTLQGCIDFYAANYDHGAGQEVTLLSAASQTYTLSESIVPKKAVGEGLLIIDFNGSTVQSASTNTIERSLINLSGVRELEITNATFHNIYNGGTRSGNVIAQVDNLSRVTFSDCSWGDLDSSEDSFSYHLVVQGGSLVNMDSGYAISGGDVSTGSPGSSSSKHIVVRLGGLINVSTQSVSITNTPVLNQFLEGTGGGYWQGFQIQWSGSLAGGCKKYDLQGGAQITAFGQNIDSGTYEFPGSVAGTADGSTSAHVT